MNGRERYRDALEDLLAYHDSRAVSRLVRVEGPVDRVHCLDTGDRGRSKAPVVLLHGAGTPVADWVPLVNAFPDRRVVAVERPGHGLSTPLDYGGWEYRTVNRTLLQRVLDDVGVESAVVVGNSFGGYHALSLALAVPERVERLVLAGAPAGVDDAPPWPTRLFGVPGVGPLWYRVSLPGDVSAAREFYDRVNVHDDSGLTDVFCRAYYHSTRVPGRRETLLSAFRDVVGVRGFADSFLLTDELADVAVPTRLVWGDRDYFGTQERGREVAQAIPDAECVGVDAAGHMPWLEPHDDGVDAIVDAL